MAIDITQLAVKIITISIALYVAFIMIKPIVEYRQKKKAERMKKES